MSLRVPALICGFCMQNSDFRTRIASLYRSQPSSIVFAFETAPLAPELQVSMGPIPYLWFLLAKQRPLDQNYKSLWVPDLTCRFMHAKSVISSRITSLHVSQTSPVVLCMPNNVISIWITCLCGSQPSFVVFAWKTATLGPELQVSMGPRLHLWFFVFKTATLAPELQVSMGLSLHLWFCVFKTVSIASETLVSMGPSPPLWLLHAKQRP